MAIKPREILDIKINHAKNGNLEALAFVDRGQGYKPRVLLLAHGRPVEVTINVKPPVSYRGEIDRVEPTADDLRVIIKGLDEEGYPYIDYTKYSELRAGVKRLSLLDQ